MCDHWDLALLNSEISRYGAECTYEDKPNHSSASRLLQKKVVSTHIKVAYTKCNWASFTFFRSLALKLSRKTLRSVILYKGFPQINVPFMII